MIGWSTVPLAELAEVFNGKTPSKLEQRNDGHPVLKIKDVSDLGEFRGAFDSFVDAALADAYVGKQLRVGDTLILNAAHNADYVGSKTYRVQPPIAGALATGEWLVIRPAESRLDPGFAFHWVNSTAARRMIRDLVKGIHLYPKDVARLRIPLPPLPEQRRIAAILDKADALRAKRRAALAKLDTFTQSIFLDMFGDPATNPKGWPSASIAQFVEEASNWNPATQPSASFRYIDIGAIDQAMKRIVAAREVLGSEAPSRARQLLKAGDVIVSTVRPNLNAVALVPPHLNGATASTGFCILRPRDRQLSSEYLFALVRSEAFVTAMVRQATGASYPAVTDSVVRSWRAPIPPPSLQEQYTHRVAKLEGVRIRQDSSLEAMEVLFNALQQRAFRGEL